MSDQQYTPLKLRSTVDQYEYNIAFYREGKNSALFLHYHDYYEFVIYLGAEPVKYLVSDHEYQVSFGDIIVCDLFDEHMMLCEENERHMRFSVGLSSSFLLACSAGKDNLMQLFNRESSIYPVIPVGAYGIHKYLEPIETLERHSLTYGQIIFEKSILHQILAYLYDDFLQSSSGIPVSTHKDYLVRELIDFINQHLSENLSLEMLANATNYNPAYLCRIFKTITNNTLSHYIADKRINTAILMMGQGISLAEISAQVGFKNYSTFYKAFKKLTGIGPEDYYKMH
ncbi:MAG: AraC family transcriptional regulator [Lawsonibacter sp.]|nr:AraC family transcriptional regulator [Lawsonibacter sp.]